MRGPHQAIWCHRRWERILKICVSMITGVGCYPIRWAIGLGDSGCQGCRERLKNGLVEDISAPGPLQIATVSYGLPTSSRLCFNPLIASLALPHLLYVSTSRHPLDGTPPMRHLVSEQQEAT